ncbi:MAG TPA: alpha/beta hydrolase [Solirubrobacterales bacterium]|jgi:pimeloyl-ACP methyl ester carboxylesterase
MDEERTGAGQNGAARTEVSVGLGTAEILRAGEGPPLLFLHAAGAGGMWSPCHAKLAERFDVVAPSHPGFGGSPLIDGVDDVEDLVYHYLELLDLLGLERVTIVGESFGGWIAAELAAHSPHRVEKLVLMGAPGLRIPGETPFDVFLATPEQLVGHLFHDLSIPARIFPSEPGIEEIVAAYTEQSAFARYAFTPFLNDPKLERRLSRIKSPSLVIWAEHDKLIPRAHGERYAERIPGAELQIVADSGHALTAEQPEATAAAILDFAAAA